MQSDITARASNEFLRRGMLEGWQENRRQDDARPVQ